MDIEGTGNLEPDDADAISMVNRMVKKSSEQKCDRAYRLAFEYESKYGCCPQCVIAAVEDVFNLKMDDVFKAGHRDKCPDVAGKVARWVSEIILARDISS
mgnify:CR=1 FL=1